MAVVYFEELWEGRDGSDGIERKRDYTRAFEVRTDNPFDDAVVVGGCPLLPRNGDAYPTDLAARMVRIRPANHPDDPTLWTVTCEYSTDLPRPQAAEAQGVDGDGNSTTAADPTARPEDPLARPPSYKVSYEQATEVVQSDRAGAAVTNSANDPFDPPVTAERSYPVITVTLNVASISFLTLNNYQDGVNAAAWRGFAARCCRIVGVDYESQYENSTAFWRVTFRVKVRGQTWDLKVLDAGYREYHPGSVGAGTPATYTRITDPETGAYPTEPQLLDGNGIKLAAGGTPVFRTYEVYNRVDFSALGI